MNPKLKVLLNTCMTEADVVSLSFDIIGHCWLTNVTCLTQKRLQHSLADFVSINSIFFSTHCEIKGVAANPDSPI